MNLSLQGTRLALTDPTRALIEEKLAEALRPLGKRDRSALHVAVEIEHRDGHRDDAARAHAYRAEATVTGLGATFRAEGAANDLEQAVVEMKRKLTRQVRDWRTRRRKAQRSGARRVVPIR